MTAGAPGAERAVERESGFDLPIGTYEEARAMIGTRTDVEFATRYSHLLFRFTPAGDNDSA